MSREVETMILRFRDLGIDPGTTIRAHREKIAQNGYTWWGWWSKFGEKVPVEVFAELAQRADEGGGIDVFLLDSGHHEVRKARLTEIFFKPNLARGPAPEQGARTPDYYKDTKLFAWLKLTEIDEHPREPGVVRDLTYVGVDPFFESAPNPYRKFSGQRVGSIDELIAQNRTIWFVRRYRDGDRTEPLPEVDEAAPYRTPFPKSWAASSSNALLVVSDLHFGKHAFPMDESASKTTLALRLERDLKDLGVRDLAGVIVAGDLSWKADPAEFEQALTFFRQLRSWSTLDFSHYVVCPGNHDLRFSEDPSDKNQPVTTAPEEARRAYAELYRKLFDHPPGTHLSMGRQFLLGGGQRIEIAALNSSLLKQERGIFQGHGFLGAQQLDEAAGELGWASRSELRHLGGKGNERRAYRIVVVHHHLVPVPFRETPYPEHRTSVVFDAEALVRWIVDHQVDMVIHGHMHEPFLSKLARPIPRAEDGAPWHELVIVGLGSTGVSDDHLPAADRNNTYALLEFGRDSVTLRLRRIDPKGELRDERKDVWKHELAYPAAVL